jgi:plastocyanin
MPRAANKQSIGPGPLELPRVIALLALLAPFVPPAAFAADLTVSARQRNAQPLQGAVITLESESSGAPPAPPVATVMDQVDMAFVPDVIVIPVHSSVQFPNSDVVSHQVYSFSGAKAFQLPLYRGRPYPPVVFDQPGIVTLGCNIHDNMLAYIVVTRATHFGRTDEAGNWTATNLPAGRYVIRLWHPLLNEGLDVGRTVVMENTNLTAQFQLSRNLRPAPLTGRPHSWDY